MKRMENDEARKYGVSKAFRQYAKRYGSDIYDMVATFKKHAARKAATKGTAK